MRLREIIRPIKRKSSTQEESCNLTTQAYHKRLSLVVFKVTTNKRMDHLAKAVIIVKSVKLKNTAIPLTLTLNNLHVNKTLIKRRPLTTLTTILSNIGNLALTLTLHIVTFIRNLTDLDFTLRSLFTKTPNSMMHLFTHLIPTKKGIQVSQEWHLLILKHISMSR